MWMAAAIALLLVGFGVVIWHFSNRVLHIKVWDHDRIEKFELDTGVLDLDYLGGLPREDFTIASPYGYTLEGWFIPAEEETDRVVILVHGVTRSRMTSIKYVNLFRKRGFNVLVYDHRRHGRSGGRTTTYGYYEKYDLKACVDWVMERLGPVAKIGIHGESMGAATALQHAGIDDRAMFYIADCPYSDFAEQLKYRLKVEYRILPAFPLIPLVGLLCRIRSGFSPRQASPIRHIAKVEKPVLFVHGENDLYIPKEMTEDLYRLKPGAKQLYLAPGADHAEALMKNPDDYDRIVGVFLQDIGLA